MNINHDSFIRIRKGIMEHLEQCKMNGREFSVYASIHFWSDYRYGIAWQLSAPFIARFLHEKESIVKRALVTLSSKGYIKRFNHRGQRTYYPILIDNYEIQKGVYTVADKTLNKDSLCLRVNFKCTLNVLQTNFKCPLSELQVSPIKEVNNIRIVDNKKKDKKAKHSFEKSPYYEFDKFKEALPKWSIEKVEQYYQSAKEYSGANGGKYLDWILAVQSWERKDNKPKKKYGIMDE